MKKTSVLLGAIFTFAISTAVFAVNPDEKKISYPMPDDVRVVLENKCYGCHNDGARSDKAKAALNFSTLESLEKFKKIASLGEMKKEVEEKKMPPARYLESHPENKLTDQESALLVSWVKQESSALLKQ